LRLILNFADMVLCVCQAVSDREVDAAIREGARSLAEVARVCGAGTDCGCCQTAIERRIEQACSGSCADCPRQRHELASAAL